MSLVSLSSNSSNIPYMNQSPFDFRNHFPQAFVLAPKSEVCLTNLTFGNYGDQTYTIKGSKNPSINDGNNKIIWSFGDRGYYGRDIAILKSGSYSGIELAVEIARAMNEGNRLKYYTIACSFTEGQPPSGEDSFTISYVETPALVETAVPGDWIADKNQPVGNTIITTGDFGEVDNIAITGKKIAISQTPESNAGIVSSGATAFGAAKGMPLFTTAAGGGYFDSTWQFCGDGSSVTGDPVMQHKVVGLCDPSLVAASAFSRGIKVDDGWDNLSTNNNGGRCNILINGCINPNNLEIRVCYPQEYPTPMSEKNNSRCEYKRLINLTGIITSKQDVLLVRITPFYRVRGFVVQILKSTDCGDTFVKLPDGTGGNNDDTDHNDDYPKVFTETLNGTATGIAPHPPAFDSCVYSTLGIPVTGGTGVADARVSDSMFINAFTPHMVYPIPVVKFRRTVDAGVEQNVITDLNLTSDTGDTEVEVQLNIDGTKTPPTTADNQYNIQFDSDTTRGYDGLISIAIPPTTDDAFATAALMTGMAFKKTSKQINKWLLYADNSVEQATATSTGQIIMTLTTPHVFTITSSEFTGSWVGSIVGDAPSIVTEPIYSMCTFVENKDDSLLYSDDSNWTNGRYAFQMNGNTPELDHDDDPHDKNDLAQQPPSGHVIAQALNEVWSGRMSRITADDVATIGDNTAYRRLRNNEPIVATSGLTLGFGDSSWENTVIDPADTDNYRKIAGKEPTLKDAHALERTVHVSIPELSNVKSLEGESNQRYKTIKVLPKDSFSEDKSASLLTYQANYEDWISINNGSELHLNEVSVQLRRPDGTLADWVDGDCRATIKFRESPEKVQERLYEKLAKRITQQQNPGQEIMIDKGDFVGS